MHRLKNRWIGDRAFLRHGALACRADHDPERHHAVREPLDNIMVGRIDEGHLRGVSVANTLIFVLTSPFSARCPARAFSGRSFRPGNREGRAARLPLPSCSSARR